MSTNIAFAVCSIHKFFNNSSESEIHNTLSKVSLLANHSKLKTAYIFETISGVAVNDKFDGLSTAIELNTECNDCITLRFPEIEQVMLYEKLANEDSELHANNHSSFLDKHVDELLCRK